SGDHGNNYVLEVTVGGVPEPGTGMVVNLKDLDHAMREAVIAKVDHKHLNRDVDFLAGVIPTAENLALAFWRELEPRLPGGSLERARLVESENNSGDLRRCRPGERPASTLRRRAAGPPPSLARGGVCGTRVGRTF